MFTNSSAYIKALMDNSVEEVNKINKKNMNEKHFLMKKMNGFIVTIETKSTY